ncbi:MAG: phage_integrase domain-containing protein, partial [Marine Group I thaumarchaeote]
MVITNMQKEEKLDEILSSLKRIEKTLKIVPDRELNVTDFDSSVQNYQNFAKNELKIEDVTIENHKSAILGFLNYSKGIIAKQTIKDYLDSNESQSWKSNQLKALRRYIRDFLKLGRWIEEFGFSKTKAKIKVIPSDQQLVEFYNLLSYQVQMIFLVLYNSGLRLGEVLALRIKDIDFGTNMINASEIHKGTTKGSWISFFTKQTSDLLQQYLGLLEHEDENFKLFSISARSVQEAFKKLSEQLGLSLYPHLLRTVFTEKCTRANVPEKYVNAFCGRVSQSILA